MIKDEENAENSKRKGIKLNKEELVY